jgi:diguanylate cyclase (GGDEF)-like protein
LRDTPPTHNLARSKLAVLPRPAQDGGEAGLGVLNRLFEKMPIISYTVDLERRVTSVCGGGLEPIARTPEAVVGRDLYEVIGLLDPSGDLDAAYRKALAGSSNSLRLGGMGRYYEVFLEPIFEGGERIVGVHTLALDQTESHAKGRALRRSDASLSRAQRLAGLGSWVYDPRTDELFASDEMRRLFDLSEPTPDARAFMRQLHPDDRVAVRETLLAAVNQRKGGFGLDYRIVSHDGTYRWARQQLDVACNSRGVVVEVSGTVLDITDRKHLEEHLRELAHFDVLTGLANRLSLSEELARMLGVNTAAGDLASAVLFVDVDRFKTVNDTLGHAAGDVLLKAIGRRIGDCLRASDYLARAGGDEFVILISPLPSPEDAARLARRITVACSAPFFVEQRELFCSVSIGISMAPSDATSADELLRNADTAMYVAKAAGRNGHRFYAAAMHADSSEHLELENDLRRAIERDQLVLHYQPIIAADGSITALEALVRWQHPARGLIGPDVFIPIAEESGFIVALGLWVLRTACRDLRAMREIAPHMRVTVNLSARQFADSALFESFTQVIDNAGLAFSALTFEITESVVMNDIEHAVRTLEAFKARGAHVAIDDFGTGYSSLAALKDLPIDTLKIDKTFIADMPGDRGDVAIVTAVVGIGRALGLYVVAEGVETAEQLAYLRSIGCDAMQGYLFSRPVPRDAIVELLQKP